MNEHSFVKSVHRKLPLDIFKWKIHDTFTGGVPDALYAGSKSILFVEYKYIKKLPAKDTTLIKTSLSPLQIIWLERMNQSASSALIIGSPDNIYIATNDFANPICKSEFMKHKTSIDDVITFISKSVTDTLKN
jgi:hypothetical protein